MRQDLEETKGKHEKDPTKCEKKEGEDDSKRGRIVRPCMCPPNKLEVWCPSGGAGAHGTIT